MIDTHQRALAELEAARRGYCVPNSIIDVKSLYCKTGDGFNNEQCTKDKSKYLNNLSNVANVFFQLTQKKAKMRSTISKKFLTHLQSTTVLHRKPETCLRIMRAYKVRLLHGYCTEILRDAYFEATKIQAISTCQRLRTMSLVFQIDESVVGALNLPKNREQAQIFGYEDNDFYENFFFNYNPNILKDTRPAFGMGAAGQHKKIAINAMKNEINDYSIIPSTMTIMKLESITQDEA